MAVEPRPLRLACPCGDLLVAADEAALVAEANAHLDEAHPDLAGRYSAEEILFLADM
jgi:hypothetical protein